MCIRDSCQRVHMLTLAFGFRALSLTQTNACAGRQWHAGLHEKDPRMVPHTLPSEAELKDMVFDLPLEVEQFTDEPEFYAAVLRIPAGYALPGAPLLLQVRSNLFCCAHVLLPGTPLLLRAPVSFATSTAFVLSGHFLSTLLLVSP